MMRKGSGSGAAIWAGLVLLWISALLSAPLASGDCAGTADACAAAKANAGDQVRLLLMTVLGVTAIGIVSLRTGHWLAQMALLVGTSAIGLLGLWVAVARSQAPDWLPVGFYFTLPAALILVAAAAVRSVRSPDIRDAD
jgi:hypothetical protein